MTRNHTAYSDSRILITGGTGSIGGELLKRILKRSPRRVVVLSNDENGLFETRSRLGDRPNVELKLGDIRDNHSLDAAMAGCDYVIHAAALKHVTFCEGNPYEAITTNILGTQNVIEHAIKHSVKKLVFISTDKAVNPSSTMGATKLLAEKLVINAGKGRTHPVFSIVRFGNVIGSRGSVLLIFEKQVREGGPMTVTDPGMTRFIMAPAEASELVLRAAEEARQGEIFVLKMKTVRIGQLADACRTYFSRRFGVESAKVKIKSIGMQPGEKMHEQLISESEMANALETRDFYILNRKTSGRTLSTATTGKGFSSSDVPPLPSAAIIDVISRLYGAET